MAELGTPRSITLPDGHKVFEGEVVGRWNIQPMSEGSPPLPYGARREGDVVVAFTDQPGGGVTLGLSFVDSHVPARWTMSVEVPSWWPV